MELSKQDSDLIEKSSQGILTLLFAPKGQEFCNGTERIMLENGEVFTVSCKGEIATAAIGIEDITKKLSEGEWEVREAFDKGAQ